MSDGRNLKTLAFSLSPFLFCLGMAGASAQGYPTKPVRILVPAAPAGGLDIMGRTIGLPLSALWGQTVVVENRPGAGVMLGTEIASKATPDGYTLLVVNANLAPNAILHDKLDVLKGLTAIIKIADLPNALAVPASSTVSSVKELVAQVKSSKMTYGSAGPGTVGNLLGEMLKLTIKAPDLVHVPYKGGNPAMVALVGGQVSMGFVSLASTMAHFKAGRIKVLAVSSGKRSRLAPDIPTISETVKGVELESWVGLLAPAGTPGTIVKAVNATVRKAVVEPDTARRLLDQGYDVQPGTPEEFNKLIQSDVAQYSRIIREAKIETH